MAPSPQEQGGEPIFQILNVADFDINNPDQYRHRRATTPRIGHTPLKDHHPIIDHTSRLDQELALYRSYLSRGATLPALPRHQKSELDARQADALFAEMERRGVFDQLWGRERGQRRSAWRQMWDLMRDCGFGFGARYGAVEDEERGYWTRVVFE